MAQVQHGGCKPTFPRYVSDGLTDIDCLLREASVAVDAACIRLRMLRADVDGHELVIGGERNATCRCYHRGEIKCSDLHSGPPSAA